MGVELKTPQPGVVVASIPMQRNSKWEQWVLIRSDAHHDNPKCLQDAEKEHLDLALKRNAGIIDLGDLFCAMQGKGDRRGSKDDVREEHQCGNYLDALVRTAADFYQPYASNIWMLGLGNHETCVHKYHETNLTERLAECLRDRTRSPVPVGGYRGNFIFTFKHGSYHASRVMYYEHGAGGASPMSMGVLWCKRRQADHVADIYASGHIHKTWYHPLSVRYMDMHHRSKAKPTYHICGGGYKDEFGAVGFHNENCRSSENLGAWWLRFFFAKDEIQMEFMHAQVK